MENYPREISIIIPVLRDEDKSQPEFLTEELGFSVTKGDVSFCIWHPAHISLEDIYTSILGTVEPQEDGGFVAFSDKYPSAVGQGDTEEEAFRDLIEAIELLKEVLKESDQ